MTQPDQIFIRQRQLRRFIRQLRQMAGVEGNQQRSVVAQLLHIGFYVRPAHQYGCLRFGIRRRVACAMFCANCSCCGFKRLGPSLPFPSSSPPAAETPGITGTGFSGICASCALRIFSALFFFPLHRDFYVPACGGVVVAASLTPFFRGDFGFGAFGEEQLLNGSPILFCHNVLRE